METASLNSADARAEGGYEHRCSRPVDLVHLARYTLGNRAVEREVLELFSTHSERYLEKLETARDRKAWIEAAHAIKGSARAIGAWQVGDLAEEIERLAGAEQDPRRTQLVAGLRGAIAQATRYIDGLFAE
jgi:HPt (histidine-containing phosphotransfer) domain-containing protein